jgi:glycosyltransferase involved in cell wall biosynthesis
MKNKLPEISIIAPVRDEKENMEWFIKDVERTVKPRYELIIVYDSDSDNSLPIARKLAATNEKIILQRNKKGKGVLNAIKTGIGKSRGKVIVVLSADRTDKTGTINKMFKKILEGYDVICPTRYSKGGKVIGKSTFKSFLSRVSGLSTPIILGIPTSDLTYSFKMFRKEVIDSIKIESKGGFEFAEELLIKAYFKGFRVTEVPTVWADRKYGKSKFKLMAWLPRYIYWYFYGLKKRLSKILAFSYSI